MKTKTKLFLILFTIVVLMTTMSFATEEAPVETPTEDTTTTEQETTEGEEANTEGANISEDSIIESDRFFAGDDISISELIDGNVFAIGKKVTISGKIAGDLFVVAENFVMESQTEIYGNVFVIASEIEINGTMYDTYLVSDKLVFGYDGFVQRDLRALSTEISLDGRVVRNSYLETDKLTLDTGFLTGGDLVYTAQADAVYMEKQEDDSVKETTTIPKEIVPGEVKYTNRSKKLFRKEVKKSVDSILKTNNIKNDMSEEQIKSVITSSVFNVAQIKTRSDLAKEGAKTVTVPKVYVYIVAVIIIALVVALILPKILSNKTNNVKETNTPKEPKKEKKEDKK